MVFRQALQLSYVWKGRPIGYRLLDRRTAVTIGDRKGVTFVTPRLEGFPGRFRLTRRIRDGVALRLGPGMSGTVSLRGQKRTVGEVLAQPAERRFLRDPGMFRSVELYPGDTADLALDKAGKLRLLIEFSETPDRVGRPPFIQDRRMARIAAGTFAGVLGALALLVLIGEQLPEEKVAMTARRFAKVSAPMVREEKARKKREQEAAERAEREQKKRDRESAESRRARREEGRIGRQDAHAKNTILPKGREDRLRAKVNKTGILAALGTARLPGSGLGRLLDREDTGGMEQALNGLAGAQLVAGRGQGGLGHTGTGLGGGGTSFGRIQGSGDLNVGAGQGRGRKGPALRRGRERDVGVTMETGTPDAEGGLTRDQVSRVVRAHAAAIRYCYEKELQRQPNLSGKIDLYWVIRPSGKVDRVKIAASTVGNTAVEGCIERQVRHWNFPRSNGDTIVQKFPFFFKGA